MKKLYLIILILVIGTIALIVLNYNKPPGNEEINKPLISGNNEPTTNNNIETRLPLERTRERVIKKPFGIKISPNNSPISPERFSGYHTGVDYEIFEDEQNANVEVFAICSGNLLKKEKISGYGGVLIQECNLENQPVTVIYGHIKISSVKQEVGEYISLGDRLALLGDAFSLDTDGERKHLHLGIHKGIAIDVRGYVQNQSELKNWIDFEEYIRSKI